MMILRGVTLFPYCDLGGGLWNISNENDIEHGGGRQPFFFPEKEKEMKICCGMLL